MDSLYRVLGERLSRILTDLLPQFGVDIPEILRAELCQPVPQDPALHTEVDISRRVLRHIKQPILDTEMGVLQAEVQRGPLLHLHSPDGFAFGNGHRQPQRQPGLPDLRESGEDVQALGDQRVHHKVQRLERFAHQGLAIDGF